jgi:ketol-acid reductoisomerase
MTAAEARKRAQENFERITRNEFDEVLEQIEISVKDGKFTTTFYKNLRQNTIDILEKEPYNYKIEKAFVSIGNYVYNISW